MGSGDSAALTAQQGILMRISESVYRHLALGIWMLALCGPSTALTVLLAPDPSNAMLFAAAQLPVAPALASGVYAVRRWRLDGDFAPFALLARGLRLNTLDVLRWWIPALTLAGLLAVNVSGGAGPGPADAVLRPASLVLMAVLLLVCAHAVVVTSAFSFRTRDVVRIAAYLLGAHVRVTLSFVSLFIVAAAITSVISEAALLLSAWAFVSLAELITRPTVTALTSRFTHSAG